MNRALPTGRKYDLDRSDAPGKEVTVRGGQGLVRSGIPSAVNAPQSRSTRGGGGAAELRSGLLPRERQSTVSAEAMQRHSFNRTACYSRQTVKCNTPWLTEVCRACSCRCFPQRILRRASGALPSAFQCRAMHWPGSWPQRGSRAPSGQHNKLWPRVMRQADVRCRSDLLLSLL